MNFLTGLKAYTFQALSAVLLVLLLFQTWNLHRSVTNLSNLKVQHAETLKDISEKTTKTALAVVLSQQQWSAALNKKDVKFRKELKDELKINDDLRNDVALGNRRLRLLGASCTKPTGTGEVPSTSGLDDAGTVRLSAETGQTVFDIRRGIIEDQKALRFLQGYVIDLQKDYDELYKKLQEGK